MRLFILSICVFIHCSAFGLNDDFVKGNQQFQAKNYEAAIDFYEANIDKNTMVSFENFYNLGNTYYRVGNYAKAILNYERALLMRPNHERLQHNLQVVNRKIEDQFSEAESFFLVSWWRNWCNLFALNVWAILAIVVSIISAFALKNWQLGESRKKRKKGFLIGFGSFAVLILLILTAWQKKTSMDNPKTAIIIQKEIPLKTSADVQSPTIFMLHSGTKIRLIDELGNWQKVRLPNDDLGWLEKGSFERI